MKAKTISRYWKYLAILLLACNTIGVVAFWLEDAKTSLLLISHEDIEERLKSNWAVGTVIRTAAAAPITTANGLSGCDSVTIILGISSK